MDAAITRVEANLSRFLSSSSRALARFISPITFFGGKLSNQVATRHFIGLDPTTIEWVYIIEARRHATKKEIANLCAGKPVNV